MNADKMNADDEELASEGDRLQLFLARAGVASRRASERLIVQGRVAVNGATVTTLGTRVKPGDVITVDGQPVSQRGRTVYIALNKPRGFVTTVVDPWGRPTVMRLVSVPERVYPVGRLDADSEGLLLLTNDGQLAYHLTHPRYGVEKEYQVLVEGVPPAEALRQLRQGVEVEGRRTAPAKVEQIKFERRGAHPSTWLRITIHEGRKRHVRRMLEAVGYTVARLVRVRFGPVVLGSLEPGESRELTLAEVEALKKASTYLG